MACEWDICFAFLPGLLRTRASYVFLYLPISTTGGVVGPTTECEGNESAAYIVKHHLNTEVNVAGWMLLDCHASPHQWHEKIDKEISFTHSNLARVKHSWRG